MNYFLPLCNTNANYSSYYDAISYSWDDDYCLGRNLKYNPNNIFMNFENSLNAYNNSHSIPFIVNNKFPVVKFYDSDNYLVGTSQLRPNCDKYGIELYNTGTIEILDNHFIVSLPTPGVGEVCSIEKVWENGTEYDFSYLVNSDGDLFIKLLTSINLDGTYGSTYSIEVEYGISTSFKGSQQFVTSFEAALHVANPTIVSATKPIIIVVFTLKIYEYTARCIRDVVSFGR